MDNLAGLKFKNSVETGIAAFGSQSAVVILGDINPGDYFFSRFENKAFSDSESERVNLRDLFLNKLCGFNCSCQVTGIDNRYSESWPPITQASFNNIVRQRLQLLNGCLAFWVSIRNKNAIGKSSNNKANKTDEAADDCNKRIPLFRRETRQVHKTILPLIERAWEEHKAKEGEEE